MKKTYSYEEIFSEIEGDAENVMMTIPPEILDHMNLKVGDTLNMKVENESLVLSKPTAKIYESPDKGKTVYERDFGAEPSTRRLVNTAVQQQWTVTYKDDEEKG